LLADLRSDGSTSRPVVGAGAAGDRDRGVIGPVRHEPLGGQRAPRELELEVAERPLADSRADGSAGTRLVTGDPGAAADAVALPRRVAGAEADVPLHRADEVKRRRRRP